MVTQQPSDNHQTLVIDGYPATIRCYQITNNHQITINHLYQPMVYTNGYLYLSLTVTNHHHNQQPSNNPPITSINHCCSHRAEAGQTGWISCNCDIATAALDVRNHLEFQRLGTERAEPLVMIVRRAESVVDHKSIVVNDAELMVYDGS